MSKRRTHSPEFKARVAMEAISWACPNFMDTDQGAHRGECTGCNELLLVVDRAELAHR